MDTSSDPSPLFDTQSLYQPKKALPTPLLKHIKPNPLHIIPKPINPPLNTEPITPSNSPSTPSQHPITTRSCSGIVKPIKQLNLHTSSLFLIPWLQIQAIKDSNLH